MEWWISLVIAYCVVTYFLGALVFVLYIMGNSRSAEQDKVKLQDLLWRLSLWALISPIFVPWWVVEFVKANKG